VKVTTLIAAAAMLFGTVVCGVARAADVGCGDTDPPPSAPTATQKSVSFTVTDFNDKVEIRLWRLSCAPLGSVIVIRFTPISGTPFACGVDFHVIEEGMQYGSIALLPANNIAFCDNVYVPTSFFLGQYSSGAHFDRDKELKLVTDGTKLDSYGFPAPHTYSVVLPANSAGGSGSKTLGSRATVTPGATLFGGFEISAQSTVYILVRGNSLGTLGVTQNFLDAPLVRLFDGQGHDLISTNGTPGFTGCSATANNGSSVVNFYANTRGQPAAARDGCTAQTLPAGVYTFTVTPSTGSSPTSGEVLFEVTLGAGTGTITKTLGSRATVSSSATLFGGFELTQSSNVYILVRGNSLGTLGVTSAFLDSPRVRLFDSGGHDLVMESPTDPGFTGCGTANSGSPVVTFYTTTRNQPPDTRDGCTSRVFAAGVYTFTVTPSTSGSVSSPSSGEVLFEVTLQ
jgi:hypothetical protein